MSTNEASQLQLVSGVGPGEGFPDSASSSSDRPLATSATHVGSDKFNWEDTENPDVAVPTQSAIAVYVNDGGAVTIRQEMMWNEEQDSIVYIHPKNIDAVIEHLQACKAALMKGLK